MASFSSILSPAVCHRRRSASEIPTFASKRLPLSPSTTSFLHRSLAPLKLTSCPGRCRAASSGPPPPSEPPSNKLPSPSKGIGASLGRFKDTVQIFVAVLFWMSLFFWSSAWDGRNNDGINKRSRFRK